MIAKFHELFQGLRRLEHALSEAASGLDVLTGLRSRLGMEEDLERERDRFVRGGKPFCLVIMDIDHFKKVNDTHGHDAGDQILAGVADHISRNLRPFDDAYRLGGEEFLLCLKETDETGGLVALERVRQTLAEQPFPLADGTSLNITASFGLISSQRNCAIDVMLARADQALYRAKKDGRNRVIVAQAD